MQFRQTGDERVLLFSHALLKQKKNYLQHVVGLSFCKFT